MGVIIFVFYLFCYFPYIKIFPYVDTQPTALLLGGILTVLIFQKRHRLNRYFIFIFMVCLVSILYLDFMDLLSTLRGILNYWSVFLIAYVVSETAHKDIFSIKILKISINLWLIAGIIEKFYDRYFFESILSDVRTSMTRGVTGLAPEPTFYGIMCIFFMVLVLENLKNRNERIFYLSNIIFQIFYLNQSSMTILFLAIYFCIYILKNINLKLFFIAIILCVLIHNGISIFMKETRVYELYKNFSSIQQIFYKDASLNARAADIYYSLKGSLENKLIPNGFLKWKEYSLNESLKKNYFYYFFPSSTGRIMSGFGSCIYELGFLGVGFILNYILVLYKKLTTKEVWVFLAIIMFSAIPLSNPMLGVILGTALSKNKKEKR